VPLAPSFRDVAGRYQGQAGARDQLIESVLLGTLNTPKQWNNVNMRFMPPSVALRRQQAEELVDWILTLR
jgi:cytochrome c551/c552